ncbi:aminoglycoside phosphotransferase [Stackebrandtia nassauensis]|uniref:Aminoglycoside phosphotransferase n=1 Tax=Stackebrandtia nassauensis (strain DSM 44728 / CIP 108903 / NRRL B-16338 / NBRC 102104 / LLR-40K-21) TaxID=446470 RepID=D3Q3F9_STANL|nr:aminoglycoside phosphotransferase [Stackebrandtia nassauensis]ADD42000.1 aminoglycoside phosphotransferase [Stackebrandtia nassauensis DSM 44728]
MLRQGDNSPVGTVSALRALTHNTGNTATGGVWRVTGAQGEAILKIATPNGDNTTAWDHWQREPLAYRDGFIADYCRDTGLSAPRLLASVDRTDGAVELWLEDVSGTPGEQWTIERLGTFATQLGAAQARWRHQPRPQWLSRRFLRHYAGRFDYPTIDWSHPTAQRFWPPDLLDGLRRLWERRWTLFDAAERLPQTVCHLDVWPKNLFARGDESILIDWAFTGEGAIGEDIGNLIPDTVLDGLLDVDSLDEIRETLTTAYTNGFRRAGGDLPEADIHRAIALTAVAKYTWLAPMMLTRLTEGTSPGSHSYDPDSGTEEVMRRRRPIFELLVNWARHTESG